MTRPTIHLPSLEEIEAGIRECLKHQTTMRLRSKENVAKAKPALARLCEVLKHRSGQPYKVRAILYSLWNGKPASFLNCVHLDYEIREDLCAVFLAFGANDFFYKEVELAIRAAGQWDWFLQERFEIEDFKSYIRAAVLEANQLLT